MLEKDEIIRILQGGVKRIISKATAPCNQHLCYKYHRSAHPSREFLFVIAGESFYLCNDSVYPCTPGTLFLFDSGLPHGHRYTCEDNNLLHVWGYFHGRSLHLSCMAVRFNGQYTIAHDMSRVTVPGEILHLIEERWNLLIRQENVTEQDVETYMKAPVNAALDEMAFRLATQTELPVSHTPIEDLKEYIRSRNGQGCSLEQLALLSGYTRGYLAHKFRDEAGMTVGKYIDKIRLEYIRHAQQRGIRQKEMAYELGFSSPAAFWNWYSKHRNKNK